MDDKEHSWHDFPNLPRLTVLPWLIWAAIILTVIFTTRALAVPIYQADEDGARIVLFDDDCKLKEVSNLKKHATWQEKGKTYIGCYGIHEGAGVVLAYFDDGAVVILPAFIFKRVSGA